MIPDAAVSGECWSYWTNHDGTEGKATLSSLVYFEPAWDY